METGEKMETKSWKNFNIFEEAEKKEYIIWNTTRNDRHCEAFLVAFFQSF